MSCSGAPNDCVLVVGASSGIGLSTALELSANGFDVLAWSRTPSPALEIDTPNEVVFRQVDVRRPDSVGEALRTMSSDGHRPDAVVYVAGVAHWGHVGDQDTEEWRDVMETNVVGAFTVLDQFAKVYRRHPARVVGIASDAAKFPSAGRSAYHSSKAALASFMESYRLEVRPLGTLVTILYPGKVNTTLSPRPAAANAATLPPSDVARVVHHVLTMDKHIEVRAIELSSIHSPYGPQ